MTLRLPPSLNQLKKINSKNGQQFTDLKETIAGYQKYVCDYCLEHNIQKISGKIDISLVFYTIYGRDLDNNFKVLFDSLVKAKIIDDDKEIMKITAVKKIVKNIDSKCELIIKQYTE